MKSTHRITYGMTVVWVDSMGQHTLTHAGPMTAPQVAAELRQLAAILELPPPGLADDSKRRQPINAVLYVTDVDRNPATLPPPLGAEFYSAPDAPGASGAT